METRGPRLCTPMMANDRMGADGVERLDINLITPLRAIPGMAAMKHAQAIPGMAAVKHAQTTLPGAGGSQWFSLAGPGTK